ncbi:MAG: phosphoribosylamine--glycine ligase [Bacteroidales bacterium]|nr:phosphoribosylamine--glycine ligase [Bacteroidales bacterium]
MKVLVIGSGGREHALAWKLAQSPLLDALFIAPGNSGTALHGRNVAIKPNDFEAITSFIREQRIDMVVVGPEEPLVRGIRDYIEQQPGLDQVAVIGPDASGARLEGSKDYAKSFMQRQGIPTARYRSFTAQGEDHSQTLQEARTFIRQLSPPYVLKASGLAAGKGVVILEDEEAAMEELQAIFGGKFGDAGSTVVIEEFLKGIELSVFVLTDGKDYLLLPEAKDYKRIGEGDTGLNTGGMGAVSPVPFADAAFMEKVESRIIRPTLKGLQDAGCRYRGFIFFGLMNVEGDPWVIEYNIRMGDPEAEVVIPRIDSDLLELFVAAKEGKLGKKNIRIAQEAATTVMLVSGGYPGSYEKGKPITGLDRITEGIVFHAGAKEEDGAVLTNGGRVLAMTAMHPNWQEALRGSYRNAALVGFDKMYFRKDIGFDLI